MSDDEKDREFERLVREFVEEVVKEFTGAAACPGMALPLGMDIDPESPTTGLRSLRGKWPKAKKKRKK